jgi:hypothetical protein
VNTPDEDEISEFELKVSQFGLTDQEVAVAQELGFTLEEMYRLKHYKIKTP